MNLSINEEKVFSKSDIYKICGMVNKNFSKVIFSEDAKRVSHRRDVAKMIYPNETNEEIVKMATIDYERTADKGVHCLFFKNDFDIFVEKVSRMLLPNLVKNVIESSSIWEYKESKRLFTQNNEKRDLSLKEVKPFNEFINKILDELELNKKDLMFTTKDKKDAKEEYYERIKKYISKSFGRTYKSFYANTYILQLKESFDCSHISEEKLRMQLNLEIQNKIMRTKTLADISDMVKKGCINYMISI